MCQILIEAAKFVVFKNLILDAHKIYLIRDKYGT